MIADAQIGLASLSDALQGWTSSAAWQSNAKAAAAHRREDVARITGVRDVDLPYEGEVIGAMQRSAQSCTATSWLFFGYVLRS